MFGYWATLFCQASTALRAIPNIQTRMQGLGVEGLANDRDLSLHAGDHRVAASSCNA
jgi:hypothetical protein